MVALKDKSVLHCVYGYIGPIVRINPREVHIKDPYFYDELYAPISGMRDKDPKSVVIFSAPTSLVATVGHQTHRMRRKLLNNFFSRRSIENIEPVIHNSLSRFLDGLTTAYKEGSVVELIDRLQGLTGDVITEYAYGENYGLQDPENYGKGIVKVVQEGTDQIHFFRFFPLVSQLLRIIPSWFMGQVFPARAAIYQLLDGVRKQSILALQQKNVSTAPQRMTIFQALTAPEVPPEERNLQRLQDEGLVLFAAGTETTATTLAVALFYILNDKRVLSKLRRELEQIMPTPQRPTTWRELEKLPYLVRTLLVYHGRPGSWLTVYFTDGSHPRGPTLFWNSYATAENLADRGLKIQGYCGASWGILSDNHLFQLT